MDLLIRNAKIVGQGSLTDIAIEAGRIAKVGKITKRARKTLDAKGMLVSPAFIDPHIHLDKVLIAEDLRPNVSGTLMEAIELIWERKRRYTVADIKRRAGKPRNCNARNIAEDSYWNG